MYIMSLKISKKTNRKRSSDDLSFLDTTPEKRSKLGDRLRKAPKQLNILHKSAVKFSVPFKSTTSENVYTLTFDFTKGYSEISCNCCSFFNKKAKKSSNCKHVSSIVVDLLKCVMNNGDNEEEVNTFLSSILEKVSF